jgi:hypothetical protein
MALGLFGGDMGWLNIVLFVGMMLLFLLGPKIMLKRILGKLQQAMNHMEANLQEAEDMFLHTVEDDPSPELRQSLEPMKNMVFSPPSNLDPAGMFDKMERVLDSSEDKMDRYVDNIAPDADEEEKANLQMAFKGVYGSQQIYVLMRHFKELIAETKSFQIGNMVKMMLPLYKEISDSQRKATEAFVNGVPIGDTVGPLVVAKLTENEPEEVAKNIIMSREELDGNEYIVLKSKGPGARLGKYGDAVEQIMADEDIERIVTVDAGMRYEGEKTGSLVEGTGVMMGGPGVEKGKIESVASEHDTPLEGYIIKQSGPEASQPMHKKIWDAHQKAVNKLRDEIRNADGTPLIVGVGNTCGAGNTKDEIDGLKEKLKPYWAQQEEETTSYFGLMKAFPMGGGDQHRFTANNTFQLFQRIVR